MTLARRSTRGFLRLVPGARPPAPTYSLEDEALIEAIERCDPRAGSEIYDRLIRIVDSTLYRIVGANDRDHDDLVQIAFEQIVSTIAKKKFAKACSLTSWAAAVTCNVALNAVRARVSERKVFDGKAAADIAMERHRDQVDLERQLEARHELARVRGHLAGMIPERAETLLLHDFFGKELSEIAVLTGASVAAAQSRLVRARRDLLERIENDRNSGDAP